MYQNMHQFMHQNAKQQLLFKLICLLEKIERKHKLLVNTANILGN
jgi:hypothetical protein